MIKHLLSFAVLILPSTVGAQPSVTSSNAMPAAGFSDTVLVSTGMNVGSSGANVTWDFSGMSVTPVATFSVMAPSSTPHSLTFPSATHSVRLTPLSSANSFYEYYRQSATGWEILGSNFTGTSGDNYAPNSKLRIPIPFNFGNSRTDTFQKIGSGIDAYTITYDGYGTLKTPGRTLNDVIRIKYQWVGGDIRYEWFTTTPLFYAATWNSNNGGTFNFLGRNATAAVRDVIAEDPAVSVFPNPANDFALVRIDAASEIEAAITLRDALGKPVLAKTAEGALTRLNISAIAAGVYLLEVRQDGNYLHRSRLIVR